MDIKCESDLIYPYNKILEVIPTFTNLPFIPL